VLYSSNGIKSCRTNAALLVSAAAGSVYIQRGAERLLTKQKQSRKRKESREPYDETGSSRGDAARKQHRHAIGKKEPPKKKKDREKQKAE